MILGVDQGTTGTRAGVMARDGRFVAQTYLPHRQIRPRPGWVEHDAEEILANVELVIERALGAAGAPVAAAALANQGETVVVWDRDSGRPLHHALVWQDDRAQPIAAALAADAALGAHAAAVTGLRLDAYFAAPKWRWLLDHVPGAAERLAAGRLGVGTLDVFLVERLTGAYVTDASTAARTLLWDIHAGRWDETLCRAFGIPTSALPEVRGCDEELGRLRRGAAAGVPLVTGVVDQPAALFGEGCLAPGEAKATFGTGCFVYANSGARSAPSQAGLLRTVAWRRGGVTTYALDGGIFAAGSVIEWLRSDLRLADTDAGLDALAAAVPDAGGVVCVPALAGLGAPHWRRGARAAWLGMSLATGRGELVRAAYEGIACRVAEVVSAVDAEAGAPVPALRVDGGLTASAVLMQIVADLLGRPVEVSAEPEATLAGACALAARATGAWRDDARVRARARPGAVYRPALDEAARLARRARFERARGLVSAFET